MDGSVLTLAPIFAAAGLTGRQHGFIRSPVRRWRGHRTRQSSAACAITGIATAVGGMLHTVPFLLPDLSVALRLAYTIVTCELIAIAIIRYRLMGGRLATTSVQVVIGGAIVFTIGLWLGRIGAG
jgi:erythrin-vacuolar iron transport family protein